MDGSKNVFDSQKYLKISRKIRAAIRRLTPARPLYFSVLWTMDEHVWICPNVLDCNIYKINENVISLNFL